MELRTHNCGELRQSDEGKHVKLCGWLSSVRDLGAVIFSYCVTTTDIRKPW